MKGTSKCARARLPHSPVVCGYAAHHWGTQHGMCSPVQSRLICSTALKPWQHALHLPATRGASCKWLNIHLPRHLHAAAAAGHRDSNNGTDAAASAAALTGPVDAYEQPPTAAANPLSGSSNLNTVPKTQRPFPSSAAEASTAASDTLSPFGLASGNPTAAAASASTNTHPAAGPSSAQTPSSPLLSSRAVHAILFNAPNSVCWLRLVLMLVGVQQATSGHAVTAFWLFVVSMLLDAVDGWLARRLGQTTSFGALLDVILDILLRGWLWVNALPAAVALLPPLLEMMVFAITHKASGAEWKTSFFAGAPAWVTAVMAGGRFSSPAGWLAVAGLMGCPLWAWAMRHLPGPDVLTTPLWGLLLIPGRALAAAVEVWVVWHYLVQLLHQDAAAAGNINSL